MRVEFTRLFFPPQEKNTSTLIDKYDRRLIIYPLGIGMNESSKKKKPEKDRRGWQKYFGLLAATPQKNKTKQNNNPPL